MVKGDSIEEGCFTFFAKKCMPQVTRNSYKSSAWPSEIKKVPEFHPISSKVLIFVVSETWIDEILCKLYVQEMHIYFSQQTIPFTTLVLQKSL